MFEKIQKLNPDIKFYKVTDKEFQEFGKVATEFDFANIESVAKSIEMPADGSQYLPSIKELERYSDIKEKIKSEIFNNNSIQIGYCWGHSHNLGALEWHKTSEVNLAVTDLVLFFGKVQDLKENEMYDSSKTVAFYIEKGTAFEVFATTMHFCPVQVDKKGFGLVVILPVGTNFPLSEPSSDPLLFRHNKWIICHENNDFLKNRGIKAGITGENFEIKF